MIIYRTSPHLNLHTCRVDIFTLENLSSSTAACTISIKCHTTVLLLRFQVSLLLSTVQSVLGMIRHIEGPQT